MDLTPPPPTLTFLQEDLREGGYAKKEARNG